MQIGDFKNRESLLCYIAIKKIAQISKYSGSEKEKEYNNYLVSIDGYILKWILVKINVIYNKQIETPKPYTVSRFAGSLRG